MIKIGLIGVGAVGGMHKEAIDLHPECELTAVCNRTLSKAEKMAEGTSIHCYSDYKEMMDKEELDAVIVNLPHDMHHDVTNYILNRGVSVLVEKPMAINVKECESMIETAKKNGVVLAVGHPQRYYAFLRCLKKIIKEERLGKLSAISLNRSCDYFTGRAAWFLDKKQSGGGILMNYGAHSMDILLYTTGLSVKRVACVGNNFLTDHNVEGSAQILLELTGGVSATVTHCGYKVAPNTNDAYYFTNGTAEIRNGIELWISEAGGPFKQVDTSGEQMHDNFMIDQMNEFIKMLKGEPNEMVTAEYGRDVIAALEKAFEQFEI